MVPGGGGGGGGGARRGWWRRLHLQEVTLRAASALLEPSCYANMVVDSEGPLLTGEVMDIIGHVFDIKSARAPWQ